MNTQYEILTESGFKDFVTISTKIVDKFYEVSFDDGTFIRCTTNHKFKNCDGEFVFASDLHVGDILSPTDKRISIIDLINDELEVFDVVEVDGHEYITDGVTSHNCDFLSSDGGLMDSYAMDTIKKEVELKVPAFEIVDGTETHTFFKLLDPLSTYIIGVDPATGSGLDSSVIQLFEFPSLEQVYEYRSNTMDAVYVYSVLKKLIAFINNIGSIVYFSVENNGVGQSIIALYMADENPPEGTFVSEDGTGKLGINTTSRSKIRTCLKMKSMVESREFKLSTNGIVNELKAYVRKAGSYVAQHGSTDDGISAMLVVIRILEEMANYDASAYTLMYKFDVPDHWKDDVHQKVEWNYTVPVFETPATDK